jgi:hypothetical protein
MSKSRSTLRAARGDLPGGGPPPPGPRGAHPEGAARAAAPAAAPRAVLRVAGRCAWQVVAGEAVLLDLLGRRIMGLNPAGSLVLARLDGVSSLVDLADALAARCGVTAERALEDVGRFLGDLAARALVEEGAAAPAAPRGDGAAGRDAGRVPAAAAYEPPAIAWEEDFEPLQAGSATAPNGPNQMSQLQGCDIL